MENETTTTQEISTEEEQVVPAHPLEDEFSQRALKAIKAIESEGELFEKTVSLLSIGHAYMTATDMAKELHHKQGKLRLSTSFESRDLMRSSFEDPNETINTKLDTLFIEMINLYLDSHIVTENSNWELYELTFKKMKVLYITLFTQGYLGIFKELHTPDYIKPMVEEALQFFREGIEGITEDWIDYLTENESEEVVSIAETVQNDFFVDSSKAINTFQRYLKQQIPTMKNYEQTYAKFLELRKAYGEFTVHIKVTDLLPIFKWNKTDFQKLRREQFLPEFQKMFLNSPYESNLRALLLKS